MYAVWKNTAFSEPSPAETQRFLGVQVLAARGSLCVLNTSRLLLTPFQIEN
jgi:hypothetical protein